MATDSDIYHPPHRPSILVGPLRVFEPRNGSVLVAVERGINAGEAASLPAAAFQKLIEDFYDQNF